ncbi:CDP-glycerol glycerophosphotransferase family protein [Serratia quinivorans]|uniref:CDP-glycerol glycerophosphotransferase family protein n=1 Tax=Serratia quinivorans TaxID=137545 RepID=UPI00398249AC
MDFLLESSIAVFCVNPLESVGQNLLLLACLHGALTFQMWHGIGPKQADLALTSVKNIADLSATKLMIGAAFPTYYISSSEFIDSKWHAFFGARKFIRASYPRNELMFRDATPLEKLGAELSDPVREALYQTDRATLLLAPTWEPDSGLNNIALLSKLVIHCQKHNINVFIKKHPFINEQNDAARNIKYLYTIPSHIDIYPHLKTFDALMTDYSSIIYDYILTGKPVATTDISKGDDFDFSLIPGDDQYR